MDKKENICFHIFNILEENTMKKKLILFMALFLYFAQYALLRAMQLLRFQQIPCF